MQEIDMNISLEEVRLLNMAQLKKMYEHMFNKKAVSRNYDFYIARVTYRLQELRYGGLRRSTQELLENMQEGSKLVRPRDFPIGTELFKKYQGKTHCIKIQSQGIEYDGNLYKSLSAVAYQITGQRISGRYFFGLAKGN